MPARQQQELYYAGEIALWLQRNCGDDLEFLGCHNMTGVSVPRGDTTPSYCRTDKMTYEAKRTRRGVPGLGAATLVTYDTVTNLLQELACAFNVYAMFSACGADEDPTNWDFLYIYYSMEPTSEDTDTVHLGIDPGDQVEVMLSMPSSFTTRLKVKRLEAQQRNVSGVTSQDILDVAFCDNPECSDLCGTQSVGCQRGWFVTASGGVAAVIGRTTNGGSTWSQVASPFSVATNNIVAVDCDGDVAIVVDGITSQYAYTWDGSTWTVVTTPARVMRDVFMLGATRAWFCGYDGYIYYSDDRGASVTLQDAGVATTQCLNSIAFADRNRGYAVGNNNAFVYTRDGGSTWIAGTGPATGLVNDDLYKVRAIANTDTVLVGDEEGNLYRSTDYGQNWTTAFAATTATVGGIRDIAACDCNVIGFIANDQDPYFYTGTSVDGVMYQSVDGGASWTAITVPSNDGLRALICCDVNQYWMVGDSGFVARAAGPTS